MRRRAASARWRSVRTGRPSEGLSSPAVQALFEQATPFADALAAAARDARTEEDTFAAGMFGGPSPRQPAPRARGRRGVHAVRGPVRRAGDARPVRAAAQRRGDRARREARAADRRRLAAADERAAPRGGAEHRPSPPQASRRRGRPRCAPGRRGAARRQRARRRSPDPEPVAPPTAEAPPLDIPPAPVVPIVPLAPGVERPEAADAAEQRLVAAGLSAALAADVVGEAVTHGLPFSAPRNIKKLIRASLARRIPVLTELGPGPRTLAFIGSGGSGKSSAVAHLAAAYVAGRRRRRGDLAARRRHAREPAAPARDRRDLRRRRHSRPSSASAPASRW